jgi:hypothetical protein
MLNVRGAHDVREMDIHTAELLIPEPSLVEAEIAIGKFRSYKSPGTDQIPAELIKAGGETLRSNIHLFVIYGVRRNCQSSGKNPIIIPTYKKGHKTDCNNYRRISLLSTAYKILSNILLARLTPYQCNYCGSSVWVPS